jgi:transmembrane sensor
MSTAREIEAAAAQWLIRRDEPDWSSRDEAELRTWLSQSDANKVAFWRLEHGWRAADRIVAPGPEPVRSARRRFRIADWRWMAAAASLAVLLLGASVVLRTAGDDWTSKAPVTRAQTRLGGHERLTLSDGSMVELNTATVIRSAISARHRDVWLDKGEAFFSVAHTGIPFLVHAGPRLITVVGTKFSVRREGSNVRVAVLEGVVRVSDSASGEDAPKATITRGDLLQSEGDSTLVMEDVAPRVERSLAWREGLLEFDQTPLVEAAQEFNRYNERKLIVTGQAGGILIGGSFKSGNEEAFVRLLHDAYGLKVESTPREIRISG